MKILLGIFLILALSGNALAAFGEVSSTVDTTRPSFGADQNVPSDVAVRYVFGAWIVTPTTIAPAEITANACSSTSIVYTQSTANAGTDTRAVPFSFVVEGGDCYEFTRAGTTGSLHVYGYVDVLYEDFEGQAHANATWESQTHANATWESQTHANATWCPLPCAPGTGDSVSNEWFNGTFVHNPTFGNVTALTLSVGWTNTSELDVLGNVTLITAADDYIPFLIYGGGLLLFLWIDAILPAVACMLVFGESMLPVSIWGNEASFLIIGTFLAIHGVLLRWPVTFMEWARGKR